MKKSLKVGRQNYLGNWDQTQSVQHLPRSENVIKQPSHSCFISQYLSFTKCYIACCLCYTAVDILMNWCFIIKINKTPSFMPPNFIEIKSEDYPLTSITFNIRRQDIPNNVDTWDLNIQKQISDIYCIEFLRIFKSWIFHCLLVLHTS